MSVDLPSPPGPTVRVTAPRGMRPFQAHSVFLGTMAEARVRVTTGFELLAASVLGAPRFFLALFEVRAISRPLPSRRGSRRRGRADLDGRSRDEREERRRRPAHGAGGAQP